MIGRLLHKSDFERLLAVPPCSRSTHFALHHVQARPAASQRPQVDMLYTGSAPQSVGSVDNISGHWLGMVIPKRHAGRAVTRNLLRRQVRSALLRHQRQLWPGLWLVRLRRPIDPAHFVSGASTVLRRTTAAELDRLLQRAAA
jgi:ribonuclease P protein component